MKIIVLIRIVMLVFLLTNFSSAMPILQLDLPAAGNNKVAYYVFDSGGPDHFPLTTFTDEANIVVLFEGTLWELADSIHYSTGWMRNVNYHYYCEIIRDVRILQARGIKVLMNVDDAASWSTSTPFTTYDGIKYNSQQFASFIKTCAIDSLHLDGISLDIEHKATGNDDYITLINEIGKYFGPLSSNSTTQMYIAAIYSGGRPGSVIGKSKDVAAYLNFIMDIAYFSSDYANRFNQWADSIGSSKTMIGVLNDFYDLSYAALAAAWQPASSTKAGIMVYAANNLKSYTDSVFNSLEISFTGIAANDAAKKEGMLQNFILKQNYPNPFNPTTVINYELSGDEFITLKVYDALGREVKTLINGYQFAGNHTVNFDGNHLPSGIYFYRLIAGVNITTRKMVLIK
jgi:Secretion system C-terminal sorting domain/Glycosyl hydrolases family 18